MTVEINLEGKVALVTGGGRGIGWAIAFTFAESGADVCLTARTESQINAVAPGWVRTELIKHLLDDPKMRSRYLKPIPLRRLGKPEEISPMVAFLCSDLSSFMTGTVVVIDGG